MKIPELDYQPFASVPAGWSQSVMAPALIMYMVLFGAVAGISAVLIGDKVFVIALIGIAGLAAFFIKQIGDQKRRREALLAFGAANNLTVITNQTDPGYSGVIFGQGHNRRITDAVIVPTDGPAIEIGNYLYVTGNGKNSQTHTFGYMKLRLPRRLPHMLLDATSNNASIFSNLPSIFAAEQRLSLEGDFDTHFKLYAPKQYERDALYVFTPDVMQLLIDQARQYDIEIVDDELYIYDAKSISLTSEPAWRKFLLLASHISPEFEAQTKRYADERTGDRGLNLIAEPGKRLKRGINWAAIIVAVAFVLLNMSDVFARLMPNQFASQLVPIVIIILPLILFIVIRRRSR